MAETIAALCIVAVIATFTVCSTINSGKMEEQNIRATSRIVSAEIETAYQDILLYQTNGFNITRMKNVDDFEEEASQSLKDNFIQYMSLSNESCNSFPSTTDTRRYLTGMSQCAYSDKKYVLGFMLEDEECNSAYDVKDYLQDDTNTRIAQDACGYVIFAPKRSKGIIGRDFFIMALGRKGIR
ncbi:MAG: hypothetical protein IJB79_01765 [Candidatus Gastranaerophilales bacterium]|nr:hypothetical protein [Candidatus Gastranaerophilales bacterium]